MNRAALLWEIADRAAWQDLPSAKTDLLHGADPDEFERLVAELVKDGLVEATSVSVKLTKPGYEWVRNNPKPKPSPSFEDEG